VDSVLGPTLVLVVVTVLGIEAVLGTEAGFETEAVVGTLDVARLGGDRSRCFLTLGSEIV
jgi:hypothetical protein